ncbi:MAG: PAS domain-containing sensor histidine kinase [Rhizobiales bacterium]|nr:PAS domain-containing sensor histidine kinase [Hyphomicrobiales bacterium]
MQYDRHPFIDLAVHKDIRDRFARGEALAVASPDLTTVVWANGPAAALFGYSSIYELIEDGIDARPSIKRQIAAAVHGLARKDGQDFLIRVSSGFRRTTVGARVELIELPGGAPAVLISAERDYPGGLTARAREIISGFDEGDAHVAVLDEAGSVLASTASFDEADLSVDDLRRMARDVEQQRDRLVKRMIHSAGGEKPAAIGRLTDDPALNLVFVVETGGETVPEDIVPEREPETLPPPLPAFDAEKVREELTATAPEGSDDALPRAFAEAQDVTNGDEAGSGDDTRGDDFDGDPLWAAVPPQPSVGEVTNGFDGEDAEEVARGIEAPVEASANALLHEDDFVFDPDGRPVRFVWKIDRNGTFSELSPEFAEAIGPNAADIIGRSFPDVARVFNLDPDHVITDLLSRRDTWSGKTVYWPIQGTELAVPVDLAALPTYTRERRFDGFRGFGIVRIGEARPDPEAIGLALVPGPWIPRQRNGEALVTDTTEDLAGTATEDPSLSDASDTLFEEVSPEGFDDESWMEEAPETDLLQEDTATVDNEATAIDETSATVSEAGPANDDATPGDDGVTEKPDEEDTSGTDPFLGEKPALVFTPNAGRRESDKVIDLEARRARSRETLSPLEQAAFREIGEKLGIGLQPRETVEPKKPVSGGDDTAILDEEPSQDLESEDPTVVPEIPEAPEEVSALFDNVDGPLTDESRHRPDEPTRSENETEHPEDADAASAEEEATSGEDGASEAVRVDSGEDEFSGDAEEEAVIEVSEQLPADLDATFGSYPPSFTSGFELPPRNAAATGLTEDVIDMIPAALLVHAGDELIHGNREFFALTGFDSLEALADAGGLDHLLSSDEETGAMLMCGLDGTEVPVNARLHSINWYDSQALLLSLARKPEIVSETIEPDSSVPAPRPEEDDEREDEASPTVFDEAASERINALEIEARELRSILETATDGVVIIGEDNRIRSMNGSAHALFGYDDADTLGQPFAMLFAHESQRAVMDYLGGLAEHGVSSVLNDGREVIGREANGGLSPLFMTIGRLSGSNGYCAVLRDITQWKQSEEELREAKRAAETANSHKSDFLARVSHEIRTPLNAIIGFSEMMVEERFGPIGSPRYLEYAHDIGNSGKHVLDIVNDLLDISKIEAGEIDLDFGAVTLNDQLAECVSMLQPMANSQRVIIRTSLSATLPDVVADTRSVKQIALNLLSNAIRYTPSGGQIVVSTAYEQNGNVVLRIRDTGIGMTRKELEQAMKPFGQVGPTPRKRGDGTGLGLPLTKAMVEANRAAFDIVSAPKEGTLVTITFPSQRVLAD